MPRKKITLYRADMEGLAEHHIRFIAGGYNAPLHADSGRFYLRYTWNEKERRHYLRHGENVMAWDGHRYADAVINLHDTKPMK